jgi:hypothetical protein
MQTMKNKINLISGPLKQTDAVSKELSSLQAIDENKRAEEKLQIEELRCRAFVGYCSEFVFIKFNGVLHKIDKN